MDSLHNSLVTIANGGNTPARAQLTILYNQGSGQYQVEQALAPDEQMVLDFGKLIRNQVPDKNGHTLPPGLMEGTYRLLDLNDNPLGSLYEGKVIVDKTYGHASYGCMICCGPNNPYMLYNPLAVAAGGSQGQTVKAVNSCSSQLVTVTGDFPTWWTDNTSIATATSSSHQINGVAVGTTNHNAQSINMYWGPREDAPSCDLSQEEPSAPTNVKPTITGPNTVWYFSNLTVTGYATSIQLTSSGGSSTTWNITAGASNITLSSFTGSSINVLSSGTAFSSSVGDVTLTATANGQTSAPFSLTTRTPNRLVPGTPHTDCDSTYGHITIVPYTIQDQLTSNLPSGVPLNENWTTANIIDYSGSTWTRPDPGFTTTTDSTFGDFISGQKLSSSPIPVPTCDGNSTAVQHSGQEWRIGSLATGFGRRVQTDTIYDYIGYGAHLSITSPVP